MCTVFFNTGSAQKVKNRHFVCDVDGNVGKVFPFKVLLL